MLNGKSYVVTDPSLAIAVQRASSTLDFDALVIELSPLLGGCSSETKTILRDVTAKQEGRTRLVTRAHSLINPPFAAHRIADISRVQLKHFHDFANNIKDGEEQDLFKMFKHEITAASMHSMYGPQNPFAMHPELLEKYWDWDDGNVGHMVGILPSITARKAHYGLEACVKGWEEYTENGRHAQAMPMLQERLKWHVAEGISTHEHARLEHTISFGFISNAAITSFWIINNIFGRPDLLHEIREEIYTNAFEAPGTISSTKLKESCPLLNSTWRETMRLISPNTSARMVLEDTILADTYLLKKDNVVQIAGGVLHFDTDIWGPDAASFNPRRFYYNWNGTKTNADGSITDSKENTIHAAAFRVFGGGTSLCPGRHFAQMEVTGLAAVLAMGFDIQIAQEGMGWNPARDETRFPIAAQKPMRDVRARIVRRKGWEDIKWELTV
jgi:cytochrome P450